MRGPIAGFRGHQVGAALAVAFAVGWLLVLFNTSGALPSLNPSYRLDAAVPTAASVASNARVTMSGADVGRVESVERRGRGALVKLEIEDDSVTPIPADSRIAIRQRTPVGENYVTIEPGRSRSKLDSGSVLPASRSDAYVDVDQVLSVLQGPTRRRARELMQGLGGALAGRGERLNALMDGSARTLQAGGRVTHVLSRDRRRLSRLVDQFGDISRAIGERHTAMRTLTRQGLVTFRAMADRDEAVRAMVDQLPPTLAQVRGTTNTLGTVTGRAAPVLANLALAMRELRPPVRLLRPAALEGRRVLGELEVAAPRLEETLGHVRTLSRPTAKALPPVNETLCQFNPMVRYLKPYTPDLIATVIGLGSASNSYDAVGHLIRLTPIATEQALNGLPPELHRAAATLTEAGLLERTRALGYDPYPPPNAVGTASPQGEGALGPTQVTAEFPRLQADC